ncbi:MAG: HAD family phosphatase [Clostridiales bacterium]|nr:HAD family phosphatase [Clostridiales bacterium]
MNKIDTDAILSGIEAVIFDLDGTLADSMWVWIDIDREFFATHNMDFPESLNREIEGLGFTETAEFFVEHFDLSETVDDLKNLWNDMAMEEYRTKVPLKPGAYGFLKYLKAHGIRTGMATSNSKELVETFLAAQGIEDMIDAITTVCEVSRGKPDPDVYLTTAARLGVAPDKCLVFEDIIMGIHAGHNAGMRVCAVDDEFAGKERDEKKQLAEYFITDFSDISITSRNP